MKRGLIYTALLCAISLPLYAEDVPVTDAEEMPAEIAELAKTTHTAPVPLKSLPAKQAQPEASAPTEASAPPEPAALFQDDTAEQKMVQGDHAPAKADLLTEMQSLQKELKQLRGQLEVQKHDMEQLTRQQTSQIKDLETKLSKSKEGSAKSKQPEKVELEEPSTEEDAEKEAELNKTYQEAFGLVREKKYAEASIAMEAFIKTYPDSQFTANAIYWLGELYLAQGFTDKGMLQFSRVVREFPTSSKAPAATLKLGYSYYEQSHWKQARTQFSTVLKNYPNSSEASLAKGRLKELDQQGL